MQLWEKNEGLPVHRHQHARLGSVYAFQSELDAWREARRVTAETTPPAAAAPAAEPAATPSRTKRRRIAVAVLLISVSLSVIWRSRSVGNEKSRSIVVLPFLDLSPQHDQEYFSDGLTEEIIDALTRVPNLHVVARTSAFAFKGKNVDIRQIGKQLEVSAVLEGSVRKDGNHLRITAQLNRVTDGTHLWSQNYDRELRDIFAVQHEISTAIADRLRAGPVPPRRGGTGDLEAYQHFQEARYFFAQTDPVSLRKAIDRYQQAIARDPGFVQAYAGLADAYAYLAETTIAAPREVMPKAKQAAEKAVALDDSASEGHISLGIVKLDYEWDREGARREFQRAKELNPGLGWARHWYAHYLESVGRIDDALTEMRAAQVLDPLAVMIAWDIANELIMSHRFDEALAHLKKSEDMFPNVWILDWETAEAYYAKHDLASAGRVIETMRKAHPEEAESPMFLSIVGAFAAHAGRTDEARRALDRLEKLRATQYVDPYMASKVAAALGDRARLHTWLERIVGDRTPYYLYIPYGDTYIDPQPEVKALMEKIRTGPPPPLE